MTQDKTGGPAFAIMKTDTHDTWPGMTLRDWFAGQALKGCGGNYDGWGANDIAELSYELADAMIAARNGGQDT